MSQGRILAQYHKGGDVVLLGARAQGSDRLCDEKWSAMLVPGVSECFVVYKQKHQIFVQFDSEQRVVLVDRIFAAITI